MTVIFGRLEKKFKLTLLTLGLLLFIFSGVGNISVADAQSFHRVCKNGIIYYYFSSRGKNGSRHPYLRYKGNKLIRSPVGRKVSPSELEPVVEKASCHYNLPPTLIKAVIRVESNFIDTATSPKGAQGLMQLMPGTAKDLQVRNPYDVRENIWAGTRYLSMLLCKFGNRLPLALAAYNAGPHRVEKHKDIPPIKETKDFVRDVCVNFISYSKEPSLSR